VLRHDRRHGDVREQTADLSEAHGGDEGSPCQRDHRLVFRCPGPGEMRDVPTFMRAAGDPLSKVRLVPSRAGFQVNIYRSRARAREAHSTPPHGLVPAVVVRWADDSRSPKFTAFLEKWSSRHDVTFIVTVQTLRDHEPYFSSGANDHDHVIRAARVFARAPQRRAAFTPLRKSI